MLNLHLSVPFDANVILHIAFINLKIRQTINQEHNSFFSYPTSFYPSSSLLFIFMINIL